MRGKVLPKDEPKKESKKLLGSEVSIRRMKSKDHNTNVIDITLKSEVESIDELIKKIPGVI